MRRMQVVKWTEHVQDRPKWKVIVEKGLYQSCSTEEEELQVFYSFACIISK
jgi:hypothetical protein